MPTSVYVAVSSHPLMIFKENHVDRSGLWGWEIKRAAGMGRLESLSLRRFPHCPASQMRRRGL